MKSEKYHIPFLLPQFEHGIYITFNVSYIVTKYKSP